jgi:hypothetical protein
MKLYSKLTVTLLAFAAAGVLAATAIAAAPTNTAPPTITGRPQQGSTLTASNGTWGGGVKAFTYRWQRCGTEGTNCNNIDNATARTYVLTSTDVGHTVRVVVTASNADGQTSAMSKTTAVVSGNAAPANTARPTISGTPRPGEELTADPGTWTNGVRAFTYQWQRCDSAGANCTDVSGANAKTYVVRTADVGSTLRVAVSAGNLVGSTKAVSDHTAVVSTGTTTTTTTTPPPATNHRPTIAIIRVRFVGLRVYARFRVCDDSRRNVGITERDTKVGVPAYTRHFRTVVPPQPCSVLTRSWRPAPRFQHGRYTIRMWARDAFGLTSRIATRTIFR